MKVRRPLAALLLLAICGAFLLPFQAHLAGQAKAANFRKTALDLDLRERIGQMGFLAALSGFRSPLAAFLWIEVHTAWENTEWGRMAGLIDTVTTLQPRSLLYWDMAAWHMAYNASVAALQDTKQPSEALRIRAQRQYFNLGREILEKGIRNNPDRYQLYLQLGVLLRDKFEDHCGAAEAFLRTADFPDAPPYARRFAAYEMAKCPGREREAYELLKKLYLEGEKQRLPTLINLLDEMEKKLDIPASERLQPH
ncbi:MAG: hypothetical protein IAE94_02065 [Chthoniobacterales bacterium]|nr:hypothetical protein [Chthoniobacterales bacterium]